MGKELPTANSEKWWKDGEKPSERLVIEALAMSSLFDTKRTVNFVLPKSSWDVKEIKITTPHLSVERFENQDIDLGWWVNFSVNDGNNLCLSKDFWRMLILPTNDYPYKQPLIAIWNDRGWVKDGHHMGPTIELKWSKWKTGETYNFPIICHCESWFHNPGFTTCMMHSQQAILWLRSRLYSLKHNIPMKDYEGTNFNG